MERKNDSNRKIFHGICIVLLTALAAALIVILLLQGNTDDVALLHTIACGMIMVMDLILVICYSVGHYEVTVVQDRIYMVLLVLIGAVLLVLAVYRLVFFAPDNHYLEPFLLRASQVLTAVWVSLFGIFDLTFFRISEKRQAKIRTIIIVLSAVFSLFAVTDPLTRLLISSAGPDGISPGPLYFLSWVYTLGMSVWYSVMILKYAENRRTKIALLIFEMQTPLWFVLDLLIGFQRNDYISFAFLETFVSFLSLFEIFCFIFIANSQRLKENEMELTQSRLNALQLQMNPHFIANSLNVLTGLTDTDPETAKHMIADLSEYLRENFCYPDEKSPMIPFSEELERLEHYMAIERIRFPGIHVNYWLEAERFEIPAMTLQPLVENAIIHGIRKKKQTEGSIEIRSSETQEAYLVFIEDDGIGFDEKELSGKGSGEKHIGIKNTRKRLELMCSGSLVLHSAPGKGTVCEITIPKQRT